MSLVGGTRGQQGLIINNYPNRELTDSGDTDYLLESCLLEEGGSGICGSAVAGRARFFLSSMDECNTASHNRSRRLRYDLSGGKWGAWLVLASSTPRLTSSDFYQPVLSGSTSSKNKNFEGLPLYSYKLEIWGKIFQVL